MNIVREGDELPGDLYLGGGCPAGATRDLGNGSGSRGYRCMGAPGHGRNGELHYAATDTSSGREYIAATWDDHEAAAHFRGKVEQAARDHANYERDRRRFLGSSYKEGPTMSTATGEATTLGAAQTAAQALDQKAQTCEQSGERCAHGAGAMSQSQASLDAALTKFQLDSRTLAASKGLQEATHALEAAAAHVGGSGRELSAASQTLLGRLGGHRRLAQAVQEHGEAAQMPWYRGGR